MHVRVGGALDQGIQHGPGGHPEDIGGDRCQLDPRILQQLVQAIGGPAPLLDQHLAMPRQVAKLPNRRRRHEAAPQQPVLQQLRDPDAVAHVGVPTRNLLDVGGVDQQTREAVLEGIEHRLPVDPRALHRHVRHPVPLQPVAQGQEFGRGCPKRPHVLLWAPVRPGTRTHAATMSRWTSSPQPRSISCSIRFSSGTGLTAARRSFLWTNLLGVLMRNKAGYRKLPRQTHHGPNRYQGASTLPEPWRAHSSQLSCCVVDQGPMPTHRKKGLTDEWKKLRR